MRRKKLCVVTGALLVLFFCGFASATDYASMTTEELSALRGTLYNASQEERDAFRTEWLKRVEQMTQEERQTYLSTGPGNGAGRRDGSGLGSGTGLGKSGGGKGNGQGNGGGNGSGNGKGRQ